MKFNYRKKRTLDNQMLKVCCRQLHVSSFGAEVAMFENYVKLFNKYQIWEISRFDISKYRTGDGS